MAVDQSEKELTMVKAERLEAIRKNAALESRFEGVQVRPSVSLSICIFYFCIGLSGKDNRDAIKN